jgi:hypothetical protein
MPKGKKRDKPQIKRWKAENPIIKTGIFRILAQDLAKPKTFTELWADLYSNNVLGTKNTLLVYLEKMRERKEIVRIPIKRKTKIKEGVERKQRYAYALPDWKEKGKKEEYDKKLRKEAKRSQMVIHRMIKLLESGILSDHQVWTLVYCTLLDFELKQLEGFDLLLRAEKISGVFAPSILRDFFAVPFNLRIPFLWACFKFYPDVSKNAINTLKIRKKQILDGLSFKEFLEIYNIADKPSG